MKSSILRAARIEKGLSRRQMADALGMAEYTYGRKERGEGDFSLDEIKIVAKLLDFDMHRVNVVFFDSVLPEVCVK